MRHDDGVSMMTTIARDLPPVRLALATLGLDLPVRQSLFQQLHNYPVGDTGKDHAPHTMGNKYNIVPVRREFLSDVDAYIGVDAGPELETLILDGLQGKSPRRYGLPFLGDNNFLPDRLEPVEQLQPAYWLEKVMDSEDGIVNNVMRLTITVDRADLSKTRSALFAPCEEKRALPSPDSWILIGYQ